MPEGPLECDSTPVLSKGPFTFDRWRKCGGVYLSNLTYLPARSQTRERWAIVIPAYNESESLPDLLAELEQVQSGQSHYDFTVVVVDDGSKDATWSWLLRKRARSLNLVALHHVQNLGVGPAMQTGIRYAYENGFDGTIQIDGDGQHPPQGIMQLLNALQESGADAAIGSRYLQGSRNVSTPVRELLSRFFAATMRIWGLSLTDATSGFRAYRRSVMHIALTCYSEDFPDLDVLVLLARRGLRIVEIPVTMRRRRHGTTTISGVRAVFFVLKGVLSIFVSAFRPLSDFDRDFPVRRPSLKQGLNGGKKEHVG